MTVTNSFTTRRGRTIRVLGPIELITMERMNNLSALFDADPRVATVSLVYGSDSEPQVKAAMAPVGPSICIAEDVTDLIGQVDPDAPEAWFRAASNRGLSHLWWSTNAPDLRPWRDQNDQTVGTAEVECATSAHFAAAARQAERGLTIVIDISWLGEHETGAQVLTTAATKALAQNDGVARIYLRGSDSLPSYAAHLLAEPRVELGGDERADICWFPNQIDFRSNLARGREWGHRVITTYLDLIAYTIPRYHASEDAWLAYRSLQRTSALVSDGITTISADVANLLLGEVPLLDPERVLAIPLGMDHIGAESVPDSVPADIAEVADQVSGRRFILVLGNDFAHKNRDFAIRTWQQLLRDGVQCDLVLAGLHVRSSSSRVDEESVLEGHVDLRGRIHRIDHVSSAARLWLLGNAAAVMYPSSAEGFGLVPYEAAALGTPTTFTRFGPLAEISGLEEAPGRWSVAEYAADLRALLSDPYWAAERVRKLQHAAQRHTWADFAATLVEFSYRISELPMSAAGAVMQETGNSTTALNALLASKTWRATEPLRKMGRKLRGRRGA